jgi:hypothetical protein
MGVPDVPALAAFVSVEGVVGAAEGSVIPAGASGTSAGTALRVIRSIMPDTPDGKSDGAGAGATFVFCGAGDAGAVAGVGWTAVLIQSSSLHRPRLELSGGSFLVAHTWSTAGRNRTGGNTGVFSDGGDARIHRLAFRRLLPIAA